MTSKHTPGPWQWERETDYSGTVFGWPDAARESSALVAEVGTDGGEELAPWQIANLNLIAAAPELLEALRELMKETRQAVGKMDVKKHFHLMVDLEAATKAVEKATGVLRNGEPYTDN